MSISKLQGEPNLHPFERISSLALGALGLGVLWRRRPGILGLTVLSAFLIWRGVTGHSPLYALIDVDTRSKPQLASDGDHDAAPGSTLSNPVDEASRESFPASDPPAT